MALFPQVSKNSGSGGVPVPQNNIMPYPKQENQIVFILVYCFGLLVS